MAGMRTTLPASIRPVVVIAAVCLFATACDGDANTPVATPDPDAIAGDAVGGSPDPVDSSPDESEPAESSPLSDFFNAGHEDVAPDTFERERRAYNEAVVDCMAVQGFEYTPATEPEGDAFDTGPWDLPKDEFVASYGYGLTTIDRDELPVVEDPNQERIDAMSPAERTAYHRALHGEIMPLDEDGYLHTGPAELERELSSTVSGEDPDLGCSGEAGEEVWGNQEDGAEEEFARFEGLIDDMVAIHDRIDQDPRVVEATRAWSDCMADAGHPFDARDDPRLEIQNQLTDLMGEEHGQAGGSALQRDIPLRRSFGDADPEALEQLRDHELELAGIDRTCTVEHEVERIRNEVQVELEQDFIEQHRDELEAYRDLTAAGGGGVG